MVCPVQTPAIVRARHAWLDEGHIREAIRRGLDGVGDKLRRGTRVLEESARPWRRRRRGRGPTRPPNARLGVRLARPVLDAYSREPSPTRFGVSQALTLAAQSPPRSPGPGRSDGRAVPGERRADAMSASSVTALRRFIKANTETPDEIRPYVGRTSPSWRPRFGVTARGHPRRARRPERRRGLRRAAPQEDRQTRRAGKRARERDARARAAQAAADALAAAVTWDGDRASLDIQALLLPLTKRGDLLVFTCDDFTAAIPQASLLDLARLRRRDLSGFVDAQGLHIRWTRRAG